jgi:starvation-inducible DNA-binding protein
MSVTTVQTVPDTSRLIAASAMHDLLPKLVALTLNAKQAHWNVTGPTFLPLHALTDIRGADTRVWADRVAERAVALGFVVDARPGTVAAVGGPFPGGRLSDHEAIAELVAQIDDVADTARGSLADLAEADAVAHNLVVEVVGGLDKYRWMLGAQTG